MSQHLNKACYNLKFLGQLDEDFPHDFWDWKTTVAFYCAIQLLKGIAEVNGEELGNNHTEIFKKLKKSNLVPVIILKSYSKMFNHSLSSRYDGYISLENFSRIQEMNYNDSRRYLNQIKDHAIGVCIKLEVNHALLSA